ncbi:MAG: DUF4417 domain-containing protein [Clostridiales bacterium]
MKSCKNKCNSCKYFSRCGGCSFCEALVCKKKCNYCSSICTYRENVDKYLDSFGNLGININQNKHIQLPIHVPVIPHRLNTSIESKFVALHAGNVLSNNGEKIVKRYLEKGYLKTLNLKIGTKTILEFYVKDRFLEGFWDKRYSVYKSIKNMNFTSVIAPNFSVYIDSPRIDHLYNIKRTSIVYNEMLDIGINTIPDISWFNHKDLDYWIDEINKKNIKLIAFSFQNVGVGLKASSHWNHSLLGLRYLINKINRNVEIILAGVSSPFRIAEIYNSTKKRNKLIILNHSAYIQSRKGILSEVRKQVPHLTFDELLEKNIIYFSKIYDEIYNSDKILKLSKLPKEKLIKLYRDYTLNQLPDSDKYISNFIFRCLKKKRVNEVVLFQNQEETQSHVKHLL